MEALIRLSWHLSQWDRSYSPSFVTPGILPSCVVMCGKEGQTVPDNSLYTHNYSTFFLYFYYFLHCKIIVKTSTLWNNTYGIMLFFRLFKVVTLCTLLAFSQPASPGIIFQQSLRSSHIWWTLVGCFSFTLQSNSSQTISIGLRSDDCGGQIIWCSSLSLSFFVK